MNVNKHVLNLKLILWNKVMVFAQVHFSWRDRTGIYFSAENSSSYLGCRLARNNQLKDLIKNLNSFLSPPPASKQKSLFLCGFFYLINYTEKQKPVTLLSSCPCLTHPFALCWIQPPRLTVYTVNKEKHKRFHAIVKDINMY